MTPVRLRCACGHSWDFVGTIPTDVSGICPRCQAARTATIGSPPMISENLTDAAFQPGITINGFEVLEEINRGGMGAIYKARQLGLNRLVALKVILPDRVGSRSAVARFEREVQAAAKLAHPNIVTVFATDLTAPVPYLVMEYVAGIDLHRLVRQTGPLSALDAVRYVRQAADGLQHAFEQGLIHRDIKPANLMVTPSPLDPPCSPPRRPLVKILDLGLARTGSGLAAGSSDLTRAGEFLGTPDFVSPEQAQNAAGADIRADLFSLGGTLYFLLTGKPPVAGDDVLGKLSNLFTEPPPCVRDDRPELPESLDVVIQTLLARNPADRFQTPAELVDTLDELVASGTLGNAPPVGPRSGRLSGLLSASPPSSRRLTPRIAATPTPGSVISVAPVVTAHSGGVRAVSLVADGQFVFTAGADGTLRVWDAARLVERKRLTADVGNVTAAVVAPGGGWAVSAANRTDPTAVGVQVWDLPTLTEDIRLLGPNGNPSCLAVSRDGRRIAAGAADGDVWVWPLDPADGKPMRFVGHTAPLAAVLFLPGPSGENAVLSADETGKLRHWDLRTGECRGVSRLPVGRLSGLAFGSLRGKQLAACGSGGLVLRGRDGVVMTLAGHIGAVRAVAYDPMGHLLASAGADGTVRVWAYDGQPLVTFTGFTGAATCVAWAADGANLFAGGADGTLRRWPAPA